MKVSISAGAFIEKNVKKYVHHTSGHEESTNEPNRCSSFLSTELLLSPLQHGYFSES